MYRLERCQTMSPPLKPCRSVSDRLRVALSKNRLEDFWALLEEGADIDTRDRYEKTLLHLVIEWKKELIVVMIVLDAGADPNAIDYQGHTPLHAAIEANSSADIIIALLNKGADIEKRDSRGMTPLVKSMYQKNNTPVVHILLAAGANVNVENLMVQAVKAKKEPEVIRLLIIAGASVNKCSTLFLPIAYAVLNGDLQVVKLLFAAGATVNLHQSPCQSTLLHYAEVAGIAQELINHGMDVNAVDNLGGTPLHIAVRKDLLDVAITLIKAGGDVHRLYGRKGDNCFHLARSKPMVKMLSLLGVDINARNRQGFTPLLTLVRLCCICFSSLVARARRSMDTNKEAISEKLNKGKSAIKEMIKYGADINAKNNIGTTVLELAVYLGDPNIILYLIKHGVQVNWRKLFSLEMTGESAIKLLIRESVIGNVKGKNLFDYQSEYCNPRPTKYIFKYAHQCKAEIELMMLKKVNCNKTIYHYVIEIAPKIKAVRLCPHYKVNDEICKSMFPIYTNKISSRLNRCYKRAGMLDVLENIDVSATTADGKGVVRLINDCKFVIAQFLSNHELVLFLLALGMKLSNDTVCPKIINCDEKSPSINS